MDAVALPGGMEHSAVAGPEGAVMLDVFQPVREDFRERAGRSRRRLPTARDDLEQHLVEPLERRVDLRRRRRSARARGSRRRASCRASTAAAEVRSPAPSRSRPRPEFRARRCGTFVSSRSMSPLARPGSDDPEHEVAVEREIRGGLRQAAARRGGRATADGPAPGCRLEALDDLRLRQRGGRSRAPSPGPSAKRDAPRATPPREA